MDVKTTTPLTTGWPIPLRPDRSSPASGLVLGQDLLVDVGPLLGLLQVGLDLAELGQVEGGDLLGLLDLLLVALDLVLELVHQLLHPLVVLLVLFLGEGQLLHAALSSPLRLLGLDKTSLLVIKLSLKILDLLLQSGDHLLAALHGQLLGLVQLGLHVLHLAVQHAPVPLSHLGVLLLSAQLVSDPGSVDHRLLGLLLGYPALSQHLLQISLHGLHLRVEFPLAGLQRLVLEGGVGHLPHHVAQLLLGSPALPVSVLQLGLGLLQLVPDGVGLPLALDQLLPGLVPVMLLGLQHLLGLPDLALVLLDGLLGLGVGAVGVLQGDVQLVEVGLQLLLVSKGFVLRLGLVLQRGLHGLHSSLVSLSQSLKLLLLLLDPGRCP